MYPQIISVQRTSCAGRPPKFKSWQDAVCWGVEQDVFATIDEATERYESLRKQHETLPIYAVWIREVAKRRMAY